MPRGAAGHRLAEVLGMTPLEYLRAFDRVNLCAGRWSSAEARDTAALLREHDAPLRCVVLLGARVSRAFGVPRSSPSGARARSWSCRTRAGRCRVWNDPRAAERARRAVRRVLRQVSADLLGRHGK